MAGCDSSLYSVLYFLNYRLLSRSIDSTTTAIQSRPAEFGKNALRECHASLAPATVVCVSAGERQEKY